jgi:hypothetical protein
LRHKKEDLKLQEKMVGVDAVLIKPSLGTTLLASHFATSAM